MTTTVFKVYDATTDLLVFPEFTDSFGMLKMPADSLTPCGPRIYTVTGIDSKWMTYTPPRTLKLESTDANDYTSSPYSVIV